MSSRREVEAKRVGRGEGICQIKLAKAGAGTGKKMFWGQFELQFKF